MRKLSTILGVLCLALAGQSQNCTVFGSDYVNNFISCANDPATASISFGPAPAPSGYGTLQINGTTPAIDLSGLTIYVPEKVRLLFTGNIIIDAETQFLGTGGIAGNSEVQFGEDGTVYKNNRGANSFLVLNQLIVTCSTNPEPMECLELQAFLPVELTSFRASVLDDQVQLDWTTATEVNNHYFSIEHSPDGRSFRPVGQMRGTGNSTETVHYRFIHRQPLVGTNYYRLKQVDFDGRFEYSDLIAVETDRSGVGISLYPNPTVERVFIQLREVPKSYAFYLTNLLGHRIDLVPNGHAGAWEFNLADLPAGVYLLRLDLDGKSHVRRIIKK